jgi:hypothetical protein
MALLGTMHSSASPVLQAGSPDPDRRLRRRKGGQRRAGFRRWRSVVAVAAAAVALTAAGPLPAALAVSTPSMTANHGAVNIAFLGPHNSLLFYWAANGSSTWHTETVAGPGSTFDVTPSIVVNGNTVNIAAVGPHSSLRFYWAFNGTATWHTENVPDAFVTSTPANRSP